jgi:nucleotide-binding universal stress UspA family protein
MESHEIVTPYARSSWIKRIVVAADGSPASRQGLEEVGVLAASLGAHVTVVFVRHVPVATAIGPAIANASVQETLDEAEAAVKHDAERVLSPSGAAWDFVVRVGSPGEELVKVVDETAADLVVVGSNRHSLMRTLLLGSTAAYLTSHSVAPVLVMRSRAASRAKPAEETAGTH